MRTTQALFVSLILFFAIIGFVFAEENLSAPSTAETGPSNDTQSNTTVDPSPPLCHDSDGGYDLFVKGTAIDKNGKSYTDYCVAEGDNPELRVSASSYLFEYSCQRSPGAAGMVGSSSRITCAGGCNDGACIQTTNTTSAGVVITEPGTFKVRQGDAIEINGITAKIREITWALQGDTEPKVEINGMNAQVCSLHKGESCKIFYGALSDSGNKGISITVNDIRKDESLPQNSRASIKIEAFNGEDIKEQITCIFKGAKAERECYTADIVKAKCKGMESCITGLSAPKGEKITWKSSCGGYQYTIQDGNDETITFECATGETNATQVENNAFRNAYWQCYDGKESWQGGESSCKPYGLWKKYASEFCNARCSSGREKCGVNSFSLSTSCYTDDTTMYNDTTDATAIIPTTSNNTQEESILVCKDSCPLDGKCYPFGYRKAGNFCSDSGKFEPQFIADKTCDNNFECGSNICISGKCVDEGFAQKIINWFKRLFGGE